jgi:prepilin-type N-terminal cleavage/methylation domain-containing protein
MKAQLQTRDRAGFTLIEVLAALGLCALLAMATASAIAFAARAERIAAGGGEASLLLQSLYAAQRLRPDDLPVAPRGWRIERTSEILTLPDESRREWHWLAIAEESREITPFTIRILDDTP